MTTLALNAGSTSLKFGLFDEVPDPLLTGEIDWSGGNRRQAVLTLRSRQAPARRSTVAVEDDFAAAACVIDAAAQAAAAHAQPIAAVGHRVVHGGLDFSASVRIDPCVKTAIARLGALAPLHNPPALRAIQTAEAALPGVPHIAVFDTAFFSRMPLSALVYPVPFEWYEKWGIRRFGFHGISHAYCAARAAQFLHRQPDSPFRLVTCHLGGGCSAAAIRNGLPLATTMGFSPLDGLMMGTRCGSLDPGILLHLQRQLGLSPADLDHALNHASGLRGVSGISPDLSAIEIAAAQGNPRAQLAFDLFVDRIRGAVASLAASLGGLDALVFTDRIGEHSPTLRAAVCDRLQFMGICLDPAANRSAEPDADLAAADSPVRILVLRAQEELMIALETQRLLQGRSRSVA